MYWLPPTGAKAFVPAVVRYEVTVIPARTGTAHDPSTSVITASLASPIPMQPPDVRQVSLASQTVTDNIDQHRANAPDRQQCDRSEGDETILSMTFSIVGRRAMTYMS